MSINVSDLVNMVGMKITGVICKDNPTKNDGSVQLTILFDNGTYLDLYSTMEGAINRIGEKNEKDKYGIDDDSTIILEAYLDNSGKTIITKG
jgi:hypothetical protein